MAGLPALKVSGVPLLRPSGRPAICSVDGCCEGTIVLHPSCVDRTLIVPEDCLALISLTHTPFTLDGEVFDYRPECAGVLSDGFVASFCDVEFATPTTICRYAIVWSGPLPWTQFQDESLPRYFAVNVRMNGALPLTGDGWVESLRVTLTSFTDCSWFVSVSNHWRWPEIGRAQLYMDENRVSFSHAVYDFGVPQTGVCEPMNNPPTVASTV